MSTSQIGDAQMAENPFDRAKRLAEMIREALIAKGAGPECAARSAELLEEQLLAEQGLCR